MGVVYSIPFMQWQMEKKPRTNILTFKQTFETYESFFNPLFFLLPPHPVLCCIASGNTAVIMAKGLRCVRLLYSSQDCLQLQSLNLCALHLLELEWRSCRICNSGFLGENISLYCSHGRNSSHINPPKDTFCSLGKAS